MPKYHVEATALVTQIIVIDADSIETAEQVAMDELRDKLMPHSVTCRMNKVSVSDFDIYDSYEVE